MRMHLRTKILLMVTVIISLITGAGMMTGVAIFSDAYAAALKSRTEAIGDSLQSQLESLLSFGIPIDELVGFEAQCREIVAKHEAISYAMVVDREGRILFHSQPQPEWQGRFLTDQKRLKAIQDGSENVLTHSKNGVQYFESFHPVLGEEGRLVGEVIVAIPAELVSQKAKRLIAWSIAVGLASLTVAVILLIVVLNAWVSEPLEHLLTAIDKVEKDGPSEAAVVGINSKDEFGKIAAAFNRMAETLQRTTVSKEYADAIIDGMTDALVVTDGTFSILRVNRAACALLRYREHELLQRDLATILEDPTDPSIERFQHELLGDKAVKNIELRLQAKDGESVPVLVSAAGLSDRNGHLYRILLVAKDITELKQAECALRESEDRYRDLVAYSRVMLCTHDLKAKILSANRAACEIFQYDEETFLAMRMSDLLVPEKRHLFADYMDEIRTRGSARGLMRIQTGQGETRILEYNNTLRTEGVRQPIVRAMLFDVTIQKRQTKEREALIQRLQKALDDVKKLSGLLPICSFCKKIRDDQGYWTQIEAYVRDHSDADFSHGICPECMKKNYPEYDDSK